MFHTETDHYSYSVQYILNIQRCTYIYIYIYIEQPILVWYILTSAGLDSTVIADMKLAVRDSETGRAVSLRPPVRKSPELLRPLSAQAQ